MNDFINPTVTELLRPFPFAVLTMLLIIIVGIANIVIRLDERNRKP